MVHPNVHGGTVSLMDGQDTRSRCKTTRRVHSPRNNGAVKGIIDAYKYILFIQLAEINLERRLGIYRRSSSDAGDQSINDTSRGKQPFLLPWRETLAMIAAQRSNENSAVANRKTWS